MDIHTHNHEHGKKNWKKYFFDFFMLFLAVFCGFLAEYFLEHRIEKEQGREFIDSYFDDLKTDTARIANYTEFDQQKLDALEHLPECFQEINKGSGQSCILNILKYSFVNKPFRRTERTRVQLANAGGFRLLPKDDADSILAVDKVYFDFEDFQNTFYQVAQNNVRTTFNQVVNYNANAQMFPPPEGKIMDEDDFNAASLAGPVLITNDKQLLNRYFNELQLYYRVTFNHKMKLLQIKQKQIHLMEYFSKKYGLK